MFFLSQNLDEDLGGLSGRAVGQQRADHEQHN